MGDTDLFLVVDSGGVPAHSTEYSHPDLFNRRIRVLATSAMRLYENSDGKGLLPLELELNWLLQLTYLSREEKQAVYNYLKQQSSNNAIKKGEIRRTLELVVQELQRGKLPSEIRHELEFEQMFLCDRFEMISCEADAWQNTLDYFAREFCNPGN